LERPRGDRIFQAKASVLSQMTLGETNDMSLVAVIQARMSSKRLPGKVLLPLNGKSIIMNQIFRVLKSKTVSRVVVATSNETSDDQLVSHLSSMPDIDIYRGSLENVFDRYRDIAAHSTEDYILRLTADCPLICNEEIDELFQKTVSIIADFSSNSHPNGAIKGFDLEFIRREALLGVEVDKLTEYEREHVTPTFYAKQDITKKLYHYEEPFRRSGLNLSVDTADDYRLLLRLENKYELSSLTFREIVQKCLN